MKATVEEASTSPKSMDWDVSRTGLAIFLATFFREVGLGSLVTLLAKSTVQVLLAEDFQPYRAMVTSLLSADTYFSRDRRDIGRTGNGGAGEVARPRRNINGYCASEPQWS